MELDEKYITTDSGNDGFGSQILARMMAAIYSKYHEINYTYRPLYVFPILDNSKIVHTDELDRGMQMFENIMNNLGIKRIDEIKEESQIITHHRTFFYQNILSNPDLYFNKNILGQIQNSYDESIPNYYEKSKLNISIHIRRGDVDPGDSLRYTHSSFYEKIINKFLNKFENAIIHVFSWDDPKIDIESERVMYHITSNGLEDFISDFNGLVHADILLVGSSTFSISAAFFNKNKVLCSKSLCPLCGLHPFPSIWEKDFNDIIGEI